MDVLAAINAFDVRFPGTSMRADYTAQQPKDDAVNKSYLAFLQKLNETENTALDIESVKKLWLAYKLKRIKNQDDLHLAIKAIKTAMKYFNAKQKDYKSLFIDFDKNAQDRTQIMRHLHHDLFTLSDTVNYKCWNLYNKLVLNWIKVPASISIDERRQVIKSQYIQVIRVAKEIQTIAEHPYSPSVANYPTSQISTTSKTRHANFFNEQQEKYNSYWLTANAARKEQAKTLFESLTKVTDDPYDENTFNYYQKALEAISKSQKTILESDKNTSRNKKGYSRLYDISVQMFLKLTQEYMSDEVLSVEEKSRLSKGLENQLKLQISTLYYRLDNEKVDHAFLKDALLPFMHNNLAEYDKDAYTPGSMEIAQLGSVLNSLNLDTVPKHLRYLVDNIDQLSSLFEQSTIDTQHGPSN
jgi:hypothetical protein